MNWPEYVRHFREDQEIGRDITDGELVVFHDNGTQVGCFRINRRTTQGQGEVLDEEQAACARDWARRTPQQRQR